MSATIARRDAFPDILKGVLIFLVVVGHVLQLVVYSGRVVWNDPLFRAIYMVHMPLFIAVSGYFQGRFRSWGVAKLLRSCLILVPVVFLTLRMIQWNATGIIPFLRNWIGSALYSYWYIWVLVMLLGITWFLRRIRQDGAVGWLLIWIVCFLIPDVWFVHYMRFLLPYYALAYVWVRSGKELPKPSWYLVSVCLVATGLLWLCWNDMTYVYTNRMRLDASTLSAVLITYAGGFVAGAAWLGLLYRLVPAPYSGRFALLLKRLGEESLGIYLLHPFLLALLRSYVPGTWFGTWNSLLWGAVVVTVCWMIVRLLSLHFVLSWPFLGRGTLRARS